MGTRAFGNGRGTATANAARGLALFGRCTGVGIGDVIAGEVVRAGRLARSAAGPAEAAILAELNAKIADFAGLIAVAIALAGIAKLTKSGQA